MGYGGETSPSTSCGAVNVGDCSFTVTTVNGPRPAHPLGSNLGNYALGAVYSDGLTIFPPGPETLPTTGTTHRDFRQLQTTTSISIIAALRKAEEWEPAPPPQPTSGVDPVDCDAMMVASRSPLPTGNHARYIGSKRESVQDRAGARRNHPRRWAPGGMIDNPTCGRIASCATLRELWCFRK